MSRPQLPNGGGGPRAFGLAFVLLAAFQQAVYWSVDVPPQVDLPQHAAQVRLWQLIDEPAYARTFELNLFTPYLLCYAMGRILATIVAPELAMRLVVALALFALPVAMLFLLRRLGGDPWWSLTGFPLAFGFTFYWGLINFQLAVPLALVVVGRSFGLPGPERGRPDGLLALLAVLLFLTHGLVCAFTLAVAGTVILLRSRDLRSAWLGVVPMVPAAVVGVVWFVLTRAEEAQVRSDPAWNPSWRRIFDLPALLLGDPNDPWAAVVGVVVVLLLLGSAARTRAEPGPKAARLAPLAAALLAVLAGPELFFRAAFLNSRFAAFVVPFAAVALPARLRRWQRLGIVLVAVGWLSVLGPRFAGFDAEAAELDPLLARMEPGRSVLGFVLEPFPAGFGAPAHLHQHARYQALGGGIADFSFAYFYVQLVRYRPGLRPVVPDAFSWRPELFDPRVHGSYDYYLVRSSRDASARLFGRSRQPLARSGRWWLYGALAVEAQERFGIEDR